MVTFVTWGTKPDCNKSYFEDGLACPGSGHQVNWTDGDGANWSGVPLWLLVGMIDDSPDVGPITLILMMLSLRRDIQ